MHLEDLAKCVQCNTVPDLLQASCLCHSIPQVDCCFTLGSEALLEQLSLVLHAVQV